MDQFSQFDDSDPFSPLLAPLPAPPPAPLPAPLPANASDALAPPPVATYHSKEALFEAIQSWAKPRGYAFSITRSIRMRHGRQKVFYSCDRHPPIRTEPRIERIQDT